MGSALEVATASRSRWRGRALCAAICVGCGAVLPATALAHGVAGQRFFPTTFAVDDPFMNDELSLLARSSEASRDGGGTVRTTSLGLGYSKTILPGFGLELDDEYRWAHGGGEGASGLGNLETALKVQLLTSDAHEALVSVALAAELGGTGSGGVGAETFSTISPTFLFGKGLGDLPPSMAYLRPIAITGAIAARFPAEGTTDGEENPTALAWAFTVQYSLMYLQSAVRDVGLGAPLDRMVAIVEVPMETCLDAGCGGRTTGSVNPGIAWVGKRLELGAAAEIPVSARSGEGVGVFLLVHLFLDDLFPGSVGRPLFP